MTVPTRHPDRSGGVLTSAAVRGMAAGVAGVAAMTAAEKLEQRFTNRPNSYIPGRTLLALARRRPPESSTPLLANHAMHWATGVVLGAVRGLWSAIGLRGPRASLAHTVVRLSTDQTLENGTGVGAPPHTWPRGEQGIDVLHKAIYSFVTGAISDLVIPARESRAGTTSH